MSRSASAFAEVLQTSQSSRTVFLKCVPAPVNFSERRGILRAVQKLTHETVETFKKLEDDSSFIVVTTKPGTATALVNDSPFTRILVTQATDASWGADYSMQGPIATPIRPLAPSKMTTDTPAFSDLGLTHRPFTLHMFAANRTYDHEEAIRKNPLHGPWPSNGSVETFTSAALRRSIPPGAMAPALRDWHTANQLFRDSVSFADEGAEGAASVLLGKKRLSSIEVFLMERIRARRNGKKIPAVMQSLAAFARENSRDARPDVETRSEDMEDLPTSPDLDSPLLSTAGDGDPSNPDVNPDAYPKTSDATQADEAKFP